MEALKISRQMLALQKQSVYSFQDIWALARTQTSSIVDQLMDKAWWIPQEYRQELANWRSLMEQEHDRLCALVDRSFDIYAKLLDPPPAAVPVKNKKSAVNQ